MGVTASSSARRPRQQPALFRRALRWRAAHSPSRTMQDEFAAVPNSSSILGRGGEDETALTVLIASVTGQHERTPPSLLCPVGRPAMAPRAVFFVDWWWIVERACNN